MMISRMRGAASLHACERPGRCAGQRGYDAPPESTPLRRPTLSNDEKRAHLIDLKREHLIDQVCTQEILPPEK